MRSEVVAVLLGLSVAAAAAGCGGRKSMANAPATADVKAREYDAALKRWSGQHKAYEKLETRLLVTATYKSGAFRDAWSDEYARRYLLSDSERDELKRSELSDAEAYHEFFFAAYTPESRWNDFSKRDSIWKVKLFDDAGNQSEPLVVTKVKNDDPKLHAFFPYFTLWTKGYTVKFAKSGLSPDSKTLRLQITSAVAAAEISFDRQGADMSVPVRVDNAGPTASAPAPN